MRRLWQYLMRLHWLVIAGIAYWILRVYGMKRWLKRAGVTVLEGERKTLALKGDPIEFSGVDDPTYLHSAWYDQFNVVRGRKDGGVRILLAHRPEWVEDYATGDFDLVLSGHAHGGQWRIPFVNRGGTSAHLTSGCLLKRRVRACLCRRAPVRRA